jgi:hypothetical protein
MALSIVPLLYMSLFAGVSAGWLTGQWIDFTYSSATMVAMFLCMAAYYAWLFWHLKSLAARAPAPMLAADSPVVGTVLAACVVVSIVSAYLIGRDPWAYGFWMDVVHISLGVVVSIGLTAGIWSVYLLARYAFAFGSTAAQARQLMRHFDASRNPVAVGYHPAP